TRDMSLGEDAPAEQPWGVAATMLTPEGTVDLGTGIGRTNDGDKRIVKVDGAAKPSSGVLGQYVRALWLTPHMDRLFMEGAGGRRRFLDRMVLGFDAGHSSRVTSYEKAMRERTRLLSEDNWDASWLSALEAQMAEHGIAIALARSHIIGQLAAAIAEHNGPSDTAFPKADVALASGFADGVDDTLNAAPSVDIEDAFAKRLASSRGRDAAAGRALEGPHRADMLVRHAPKNMDAQACSTGEQKALLIGLVLANARLHCSSFGAPPLLLLDEVAAHLDARRRAALFDELERLGAQAWMTGTDASLFESLGDRAQLFNVAHGEITPHT
ncbi:MAG: DNA replication/repair protein RecF, partial [Pseudomonadota bacterium]